MSASGPADAGQPRAEASLHNGNGAAGGSETALQRLAGVLRGRGGVIATLLVEGVQERPSSQGGPAQLAASGPRASVDPAEYELLIEAIYEGYLLHYATPRLLEVPEADLALLAGDQLYALGLARLVSLGDVAAVAELADVITLCALAHGAQRPELAAAVWQAGAYAIGWGQSSAHQHAKELARAGSAEALSAMRNAVGPAL